tara:strand:+ start:2803 stop:2979 length:177 start_codon:yes stop_codon:yes gene_type:complete
MDDIKDLLKILAFLFIVLGGLVLLGSCDDNAYYNIMGYEINEEAKIDSTFNEISDPAL